MRFYISATPEIIPPSQVLYMRRTGEYGAENHALMNRFKKWVKDNDLYGENTAIYAIPMDDPQKVEACQCRYDVCIHRPKNQVYTQDQIRGRELEGGRYFVFRIPHTAEAVCTAWKMCFSVLEELGYCLDTSRPVMERYRKNMVENHCCELCMPIV